MLASARRLFGQQKFIFQQDNDPKHTSKSCKRYLINKKVNVLDWPAQSPDLNPIENLWSIIDHSLKDRKPNTVEELMQILQEGWDNIAEVTLHNLVESMQRRCNEVIRNNGYPIRY
jgi:transposase